MDDTLRESGTAGGDLPSAPRVEAARPPVVIEPWPADALAIVPMRNLVIFPHALTPVVVGREASLRAIQEAVDRATGAEGINMPLGFLLQKDAAADAPGPDQLCTVGTQVRVLRQMPDSGQMQLVCLGQGRWRVRRWLLESPFLLAQVEPVVDEEGDAASRTAAEAAALRLRERAGELLSILPGVPAELLHAVQATRSPAQVGDVVAGLLEAEVAEKQQWLEMTDAPARLEVILRRLEHRVEVLKLSREIGLRTREQLQDRERRALLREQLQAIRKELGEEDSAQREAARLRERLEAAGLPEDIQAEVMGELERLSHLPEASSEHALLRTWLQTVAELPWTIAPRQAQPVSQVLAHARTVLDADHEGLEKIKRELLEQLAVRQLRPQSPAPILCLVGPPGVGKTSLGQSIARALDRPFGRLSLGGVHDESEIRGHRRTYIGAMPGLILQTLRRCGSRDAVVMLDEIDKLASSGHGDPTAAMLEVLDPAQNHAFRDHYLGLPFDLSSVMFIGTANVLESISPPLRDRLEAIELPGYTTEDKVRIARGHLLPRQREAAGLPEGSAQMDEAVIEAVIEGHTREAGVRQLERSLARLLRHAAWQYAQDGQAPASIGLEDLAPVLGPARHEREIALRQALTGVSTGLAWTAAGGDILFVEASRMPGTGRLLLTGQLGEVMRESAQAALTLLKARAQQWGIPASAFEAVDVHVHVPAGAIPKDGPSAGVAMLVALASLFSGRAVAHDLAMTGEISLRGRVLPVGGIREKVLAAARAGMRRVMLPVGNLRDWPEVPESARNRLQVLWAETADEAVDAAWAALPGPAPDAVTGAERISP